MKKNMMKLFLLMVTFSMAIGSKVQAQTSESNIESEPSTSIEKNIDGDYKLVEDAQMGLEKLNTKEIKELSKEIGIKSDKILGVREMVVPAEIKLNSKAYIGEETKHQIEIPIEFELKKIIVDNNTKEGTTVNNSAREETENYYVLKASTGDVKTIYSTDQNEIHLVTEIIWVDYAGLSNKLLSVHGWRDTIAPNGNASYSYSKTGYAYCGGGDWNNKGEFHAYPNLSGYGFRLNAQAYNRDGKQISVNIHTTLFD